MLCCLSLLLIVCFVLEVRHEVTSQLVTAHVHVAEFLEECYICQSSGGVLSERDVEWQLLLSATACGVCDAVDVPAVDLYLFNRLILASALALAARQEKDADTLAADSISSLKLRWSSTSA